MSACLKWLVTEYHHPDRLGTKLITNPATNTAKEQGTLPYGTVLDSETTASTNQKFTSYDRSDKTGLDYAVNRIYSSEQARFLQPDPIGMASADLTDPQSLNMYSYARNNPIDLVDPSGTHPRYIRYFLDGIEISEEMGLQMLESEAVEPSAGYSGPLGFWVDFNDWSKTDEYGFPGTGTRFIVNRSYVSRLLKNARSKPRDAGVIATVDVHWVNGKYDMDNVKWDFRDISLDALILAKPKHYSLKSGVTLTSQVESQVSQLADHYYAITGQDIVVTSGTRSAQSQAKAMYGKLVAGGNLNIYANRNAAGQILSAFTSGKSSGKTSAAIITGMTNVIQNQVNKGTYISKHLRSGAVDIRSWNMTPAQKSVFRTVASNFASTVLLERRPPHWHLQF